MHFSIRIDHQGRKSNAQVHRSRVCRAREIQGGEEAAEAGFTLIELMVVLLIIAILLAIAIPTFLGVTGSANDRAAQSNLTNALTEAKALYQNCQSYAWQRNLAAGNASVRQPRNSRGSPRRSAGCATSAGTDQH